MAEDKPTQRAKVISHEIRQWLETVSGTFHIRDLYGWIPELSKTANDKRKISAYLSRMESEGLIEHNGKYGQFRKIETQLDRMDIVGANETPIDVWLPFNLTEYAQIMPGGIILIAGEQDTGKTTFALNIAWANRHSWDVHYFNSELSAGGLKKRTLQFQNTEPMQWAEKINFYSLSHDFQDHIKKGPDKLNIIDFMEVGGDDYPYVASWIRAIHDKIIDNGAVVVLCLQKPPGRDEATGGRGTLDKPRLYLAISRGTIKIVRAKDWAGSVNPRDMTVDFKIIHGSELIPVSAWSKVDRWRI
jgi:hypothetical protein